MDVFLTTEDNRRFRVLRSTPKRDKWKDVKVTKFFQDNPQFLYNASDNTVCLVEEIVDAKFTDLPKDYKPIDITI